MKTFAENLTFLRRINKLRQIDLCKVVNKSVSTISAWEKETREPEVEDVYNLARFFGCSMEQLWRGTVTDIKAVR